MHESIASALGSLNPADPQYATRFVELLLAAAHAQGASDVHLQPTPDGLALRWRVDGVLVDLGVFPAGVAANVVARLKVLAELLTYRTDVPQEGRLRGDGSPGEIRVSTFPTLYGERLVVRLFGKTDQLRQLDQLGLPAEILSRLRGLLAETSGAVLITGPAGSGKTTTLYACLDELVRGGQRSIITLEDPIEVAVPGAAQSQVNPAIGFDLASGLRSALRQDPEVIMVGEMRDAATATAAIQASLTGQLVLSSFHAGSTAQALGRLLDMGLEPYMIAGGLRAIVHQRLVRTLCECARPAASPAEHLGFDVPSARTAVGCRQCNSLGYRGRLVLAEMLTVDAPAVTQAILRGADVAAIESAARQAGMIDQWQRAAAAIAAGRTSPAEARRVLGFGRHEG